MQGTAKAKGARRKAKGIHEDLEGTRRAKGGCAKRGARPKVESPRSKVASRARRGVSGFWLKKEEKAFGTANERRRGGLLTISDSWVKYLRESVNEPFFESLP